MNWAVFVVGVGLVLTGLWNRHEVERSLLLFGVGSALVVIGGLMTLTGIELNGE